MLGMTYKKCLDAVRSNDRLTSWLWGVRIHRKMIPFTWDVTTLCLKKAFDQMVPTDPFAFLDMGCGHLGLLGQYIKTVRPDASVTAIDLYPEFAENARMNIDANRLDIDVRQGDLYDGIVGKFDVISFNPPYKPDDGSVTLDYHATTFSGIDGMDATRRFLSGAHQFLTDRGRVFLGINCFFVPENICLKVIEEQNFMVDQIVYRRMNTARVFVLSPGRSEQGDGQITHHGLGSEQAFLPGSVVSQ